MSLHTDDSAAELKQCVAGMRRGEERALERLYDLTVGKVHAISRLILRDPSDAEENTCETYAGAWASAGRYDPARGSVLGWLLVICRSRAIDRLRGRRRAPRTVEVCSIEESEIESVPAPEEWLESIEQGTRVYAALSALSPERQRLVALAFLRGLSHAEVAEQTGLPLGTVKSHLRRALLQLRALLEEP